MEAPYARNGAGGNCGNWSSGGGGFRRRWRDGEERDGEEKVGVSVY